MKQFVIKDSFFLNRVLTIENFYTTTDVIELLDLQRAYGYIKSLKFLSFFMIQGKDKMNRIIKC